MHKINQAPQLFREKIVKAGAKKNLQINRFVTTKLHGHPSVHVNNQTSSNTSSPNASLTTSTSHLSNVAGVSLLYQYFAFMSYFLGQ